ncbi:MAG: hypothetical protein EAY81_07875 [Bacteroidetes bacterium]|nr:MAG: hypothetical protein EAY81_07875 [Bacteroidota bacterium]
MIITINVKRLLLTTTVCTFAAVLPLIVTTTESFYPYYVPLLFSIAVTLTSFNRIITKRKYQAFVITALLMTSLFFLSIMLGLSLVDSFFSQYALYFICVLSGLLTVLIFSMAVKIDNLKFGLIVTSLLALSTPLITKQLQGQKILNIGFFDDPATFFIIWQTIIGLALAISIWTKTSTETENN